MRCVLRLRLGLLAMVLLASSSWLRQKPLNDERTALVKAGTVNTIEYDAPIQDQQVTITTSSPGVPVDVYVVLQDNLQKAQDALQGGAPPENTVASQKKTEQASLEAKVPAKKGFAVLINNSVNNNKDANVKVKATSK